MLQQDPSDLRSNSGEEVSLQQRMWFSKESKAVTGTLWNESTNAAFASGRDVKCTDLGVANVCEWLTDSVAHRPANFTS